MSGSATHVLKLTVDTNSHARAIADHIAAFRDEHQSWCDFLIPCASNERPVRHAAPVLVRGNKIFCVVMNEASVDLLQEYPNILEAEFFRFSTMAEALTSFSCDPRKVVYRKNRSVQARAPVKNLPEIFPHS